ncbi:Structural maintenance of chromosomes protein 4 [Toxocara canis]|uniref:Structural maintenance of chromosomes protein 4 n=1 Tax=Toxocara canis TaxID=6265 RepID=A0A0B2VE01_TOXCA|nr:Structural maintenance of chromosomes protein 4 [Toxocara canis]
MTLPTHTGGERKQPAKRAEKDTGGMNDDRPLVEEDNGEDEDLRAQMLNDIDEEDLLHMEIPPKPEPVMSSDGTGQRLVIHSIEVENFKSYYGKHVIGPFHHVGIFACQRSSYLITLNFSAIVGPNGSGKSNVIDSLLFVFGYRASKIRSKKISVLIHSSKDNNNLPSCTVCINFQKIIDQPSRKFDIVDGSRFKVSRTAYRDNSSKYTYNGKTVQFRDIAKRLREVGIDLIHNRFLILQGEVEQIALMKPKGLTENDEGMLEYLEDIIGSSRLKVPIEKLEKKIDSLREERSNQVMRLKMAENEKDKLEEPVKKIVMALRVENGVTLCKNRLLQVDKVGVVSALHLEEEEQKKLVDELSGAKRVHDEMIEACSGRKKELDDLQREVERSQEAYEKAKNEAAEYERTSGKRKAEQVRFSEKKMKLLEDIKKEVKKIDDLESLPAKAKAKIEEYEKALTDIDEVISEKKAETDERLAVFAEETKELQAKKKVQEEKLGKLAEQEDEAGSKLTLAQEVLQQLQSEEEKERKKVHELKNSLEEATNMLETKQRELAKVCKLLPNLEEEVKRSKAELAAKREDEAECAENVRSCRAKFEKKRQAVEASMSQNNLLNRLMREKAAGVIPGIYGRLGDLGAIDQKYDIAISTTCGALDYIVVDSVETAQQCVEVLKREGLGIASFIALDKQEKLRPLMKKPEHTPENVPRLFDLIRVADEAVLPAFYYALRDTLIAEDIAIATRIGVGGKERHRVVTLSGEVVEPSGTVTGGGRSEKRGRIGQDIKVDTSKCAANEVSALQKYLDEEQQRLAGIRREVQQVETRLNSVKADYDRMKRSEQNLKADVGPLEEKIQGLGRRLSEQKARAKGAAADEVAVERARQKVTELEKACEVADEVREQIAEISEKIQCVYARVVEPFKNQLDDATAKKQAVSKAISKERGSVNSAERNLNKAKARKRDLEADLRETEEALEKIQSDCENHTKITAQMMREKSEHQEKVKEAENRLKEASDRFSELDLAEVDLRRKVNELERSIEDKKERVAQARAEVAAVDKKEGEVLAQGDATGIIQIHSLPVYSAEEIDNFNISDIKFTLANLEKRKVGKVPNLHDLQEYIAKLERYDKESSRLKEISIKSDQHRDFCDKLKKTRLVEFMEGFGEIRAALKEMYQMITLGGDASLDFVDSLDPFSEGIYFGVRPPKKTWKQISNLSGGEKTLSSLALVFALHHYRPTPLYVMDEIDAALDFRNVSIIAHYIKDRTKNAQFIIISLRSNMFELGDRLVGIYKTFDCTKNVLVDASITCGNMRSQRAVLDALGRLQVDHEGKAALHPSREAGKAVCAVKGCADVPVERSDKSETPRIARVTNDSASIIPTSAVGQSDENEAPSVARDASDGPNRVGISPVRHSSELPSESGRNDSMDIPPFRGDRKRLSPNQKKHMAEFVTYVRRTKEFAEPLVAIEQQHSSVSPPSKKKRSPRKRSSSHRSRSHRTILESASEKRSPIKSRKASPCTKPVADLKTAEEVLGVSTVHRAANGPDGRLLDVSGSSGDSAFLDS